jgi:Holliday junction DNA helicase RuvB
MAIPAHPVDEGELRLDNTLRPTSFDQFTGQRKVVDNLRIYIQAASGRGESIDHVLFSGLPGLGKTTLAGLVARELNASLKTTTGPVLSKAADLAGILTTLEEGDVLFIDEIHRISPVVEEYLYSAMEDYEINILIDTGPSPRSVTISLPRFTLVGATTREGLLSDPFRARFGVLEKLELYPVEDLAQIIRRSASILEVVIDEDALELIARRARGTPRIANRFLRRIRDLAQVKSDNRITTSIANEGLDMLGVDPCGLDETDRKILRCLINAGAPVGLKTVSVTVGEETDTIENVYEPFLITEGFLIKTTRGRSATKKAYEHLGMDAPQGDLF